MDKRILKLSMILFSVLILSLFLFSDISADIYSSISGRVIAEDTGEGVGGVSVLALMVGKKEHYYATTDKRGVYVLEDLKSGTYIIGFHKGDSPYLFGSPHLRVILPKGKNVVNVNHVLTLGGSVSGTVYDADGVTPLSGVGISADVPNPQPKWIDGSRAKLTDSNGKFLLQGLLESDNCIVQVNVRGHASLTKTVKITKGQVTENVNFVVKWDDITGITGHVRSSIDNKPIKNARIVLFDSSGENIASSRTDENGEYSIIGVEPGIYEATAFWPTGGVWIDKPNVIIEHGKSTIVNFEFDKPAPTSKNEKGIWNVFVGLFVTNAHAAIVGGYPEPKIKGCDKTKKKDIIDAYETLKNTIDTSPCMSEGIRTKLKKKINKGVTIKCQTSADPYCFGTCAYTYHYVAADIFLCPGSFNSSRCGCLEAVMLHEQSFHLSNHSTYEVGLGINASTSRHGCTVTCA